MHLQFAFEERNEDASKAINASSFDHKMQALCSALFEERNEDASKALNACFIWK